MKPRGIRQSEKLFTASGIGKIPRVNNFPQRDFSFCRASQSRQEKSRENIRENGVSGECSRQQRFRDR
jgi:hypothetical protein